MQKAESTIAEQLYVPIKEIRFKTIDDISHSNMTKIVTKITDRKPRMPDSICWIDNGKICREGVSLPELGKQLERIQNDGVIVHVKGWGSCMHVRDYEAFGDPNGGVRSSSRTIPCESFIQKVKDHMLPYVDDIHSNVYIQWDGDRIVSSEGGFSNFAVFIYGIAAALGTRLQGFICQRLGPTDPQFRSAPREFCKLAGLNDLTQTFGKPCIFAVYAENKRDRLLQLQTDYGYWGATLLNEFQQSELIVAFGGGSTLMQEDRHILRVRRIVGVPLTRMGGAETSKFALRYIN